MQTNGNGRTNGNGNGKKPEAVAARGRPFTNGHDPRRGHGPAKGSMLAGQPSKEWKDWMRRLVNRSQTYRFIEACLNGEKGDANFWKALEYASERGLGKAVQMVHNNGGITIRIVHE